jgi:hypothetical protein
MEIRMSEPDEGWEQIDPEDEAAMNRMRKAFEKGTPVFRWKAEVTHMESQKRHDKPWDADDDYWEKEMKKLIEEGE